MESSAGIAAKDGAQGAAGAGFRAGPLGATALLLLVFPWVLKATVGPLSSPAS